MEHNITVNIQTFFSFKLSVIKNEACEKIRQKMIMKWAYVPVKLFAFRGVSLTDYKLNRFVTFAEE